MTFNGKRTDRIRLPRQLGCDPELGRLIRARAERRGRQIEMQLLYFIMVGIENDPEAIGNEHRNAASQATAHDCIQPHMAPRKSTPRHVEAEEEVA